MQLGIVMNMMKEKEDEVGNYAIIVKTLITP